MNFENMEYGEETSEPRFVFLGYGRKIYIRILGLLSECGTWH